MFNNVSPKAIALATISFAVVGGAGILVETTKGELFEIRKSLAAMEEAKASNKAAEASALDAVNKLKGTIETASAMNNVGRLTSIATIEAARQIANAQIISAQTNMYPDIATYDGLTGPLVAEPSKKIAKLNEQINRLKHQALRSTGDRELADYTAKIGELEEEKEIVGQTASQNVGDLMNVMMGGVFQMFSGMGKPSANAQTATPTARSVAQAQ